MCVVTVSLNFMLNLILLLSRVFKNPSDRGNRNGHKMIIPCFLLLVSSVFGQVPFNPLVNPFSPLVNQYPQYTDSTIQRYWNGIRMFHSYTVTNSTYPYSVEPLGSIREEDVGRVVSATNEAAMAAVCSTPLVSVTRYERTAQTGTIVTPAPQIPGYPYLGQLGYPYPGLSQPGYLNPVSLFATTVPPSGEWAARENFFCSSTLGNCGANFPLIMYPMNDGTIQTTSDLFYPSNPGQIATMNAGLANWSRNGTIVCYVWK